MHYGRFGLRTECPRCGSHLPVNAPVPRTTCPACGAAVTIPQGVVDEMIDALNRGVRAGTSTPLDVTFRWTADPVDAEPCPRCAEPVPEGAPCACTSEAVKVPKWLGRHGVDRVYGAAEAAPPPVAKPVVLSCPSCGAALTVDHTRQRVTPCDHCGSQVHLPDAVWNQLHPPRTVEPWFLRFQGRPQRGSKGPAPKAQAKSRPVSAAYARKIAEANARESARIAAMPRPEPPPASPPAGTPASKPRSRSGGNGVLVGVFVAGVAALLVLAGIVAGFYVLAG